MDQLCQDFQKTILAKMETLEGVPVMSRLPEALRVDIFVKLPAKSIGICRCVCKIWYNLLCDPMFIKNHVDYSNQNKNINHKLMLVDHNYNCSTKDSMYSVDYASLPLLIRAVRIDYPFENSKVNTRFDIFGSCNGLLCLGIAYGEKCAPTGIIKYKYCVCIWNPLTRECKEISAPLLIYQKQVRIGFGYDCNRDTYKLVILDNNKGTEGLRIEVYTLGTDSFNKVQAAVPYSFRWETTTVSGLLFRGALHWLGTAKATHETSSEVIVSFDISTERVGDVPLPEHILAEPPSPWNTNRRSVAALGENLCIFNFIDSLADVWVLQEYGVRVSWTKKFSITQQIIPRLNQISRFICALENGELLMVGNMAFAVYDPEKKILTELNVQTESMRISKAEKYVESLVSPYSGTCVAKAY